MVGLPSSSSFLPEFTLETFPLGQVPDLKNLLSKGKRAGRFSVIQNMGFWWNQGGKLHEPCLAVSALLITGAGDKLDVPSVLSLGHPVRGGSSVTPPRGFERRMTFKVRALCQKSLPMNMILLFFLFCLFLFQIN